MKQTIIALSMMLWCAATARAQQLRGVVRDSATQTPLPGVVITLVNANGGTLARAISNERGAYVVGPTTGAHTIGAIRIGFRPRVVPFVDGATLDLTMTPIPPLLEPVTVRAATNCPARPDRLQALSLLQQARAGLLATVTARQTNKAALTRLRFVRDWDTQTKHIIEQRVTLDSSGGHADAFGAVRSGAEFVATGFAGTAPNGAPIHYGPDAETLLDDDFAFGYCFQIANPDRARPNEIGLAFKPSSRKRGRVDIDGTLWVDTVANALRDIEFEYVGDAREAAPKTGGHIEFRTMGNGIVIIDRWMLRLFTLRTEQKLNGEVWVTNAAQDVGGEVATAVWDDGFTWRAQLGSLRALAVDYRNFAARGIVVRLKDTDYIASPNAQGILEIPYLLPGPYVATVVDSASTLLGITMPTSLSFEAQRDSTIERSFSIPNHEDVILNSCLTRITDGSEPEPLVMTVMDAFGKHAAGAVVEVTYQGGPPPGASARSTNDWSGAVTESIDVDDNGMARSCLRYRTGDFFNVLVTYGNAQPFQGRYRVGARAITIRLYGKKR